MEQARPSKVQWVQIFSFYLLACLLSAPFRLGQLSPNWYKEWAVSGQLVFVKGLFEGIGPLLAGLAAITLSLKNNQRWINFFGESTRGSLAFASATVIACTLVGLPTGHYNEPINGAITGTILLLYCISEELFWRGYLQNALRPISIMPRYILIGLLWYGWHLGFLLPTTFVSQLTHLGLISLGSFMIGKLAEDTKSILAAASAHSIFTIFYALPIELRFKLLITTVIIGIWLVARLRWYKRIEQARLIKH